MRARSRSAVQSAPVQIASRWEAVCCSCFLCKYKGGGKLMGLEAKHCPCTSRNRFPFTYFRQLTVCSHSEMCRRVWDKYFARFNDDRISKKFLTAFRQNFTVHYSYTTSGGPWLRAINQNPPQLQLPCCSKNWPNVPLMPFYEKRDICCTLAPVHF